MELFIFQFAAIVVLTLCTTVAFDSFMEHRSNRKSK